MFPLLLVTFAIYTLNITGFAVGRFVLCESCLKDEPVDIIFWLIFGAAIVLFRLYPSIGQYVLLGFFLLSIAVQYHFTFRYLYRPDANKIASYNKYFAHTHHIIPASGERLIPDTYHILLFALLFLNLVAIILYIIIG